MSALYLHQKRSNVTSSLSLIPFLEGRNALRPQGRNALKSPPPSKRQEVSQLHWGYEQSRKSTSHTADYGREAKA